MAKQNSRYAAKQVINLIMEDTSVTWSNVEESSDDSSGMQLCPIIIVNFSRICSLSLYHIIAFAYKVRLNTIFE